jgi:putative membrane protein
VRRAARAYAGDHKKSAAETKRLAKALGVQADFSPSPSQQWEIQMLANIDASVFDHWYSYLETLDHKQDLFEARQEVENGSNPSVVASARKEIPMLKRHLKLARAAQQANPLR